MALIIDVNTANPGNEPFTRANLWINGVTSGSNGDGIRDVLVLRMFEWWSNQPEFKREPIPTKLVIPPFFMRFGSLFNSQFLGGSFF